MIERCSTRGLDIPQQGCSILLAPHALSRSKPRLTLHVTQSEQSSPISKALRFIRGIQQAEFFLRQMGGAA